MTQPGDSAGVGGPVRRRREKLAPDPAIRHQLVAAGAELVRENGVRGLSVAGVLERCGLGTRAFYRHFEGKDALLAAVFLDAAQAETRRLRRRMRAAPSAADAVVAWIDGRLDLAFDATVKSDLRQLSEEAQSLMISSPALVQEAFGEMLTPLVEQLQRGLDDGLFDGIDPATDAQLIQGAVWACTERQWVAGDATHSDIRAAVLRSTLRGLGVAPQTIAGVLAQN
ncbi:MAG: TetR/AcrR family transcriptional regulator [Mycolicibacterium sp.]|jgi:AcrR family transcriptional regulator|uniref:TetR family transcriptional regulator n=1 Tax=Mycolicibacterium insubricum TaxID=444597 RepID=A0A1X0D181_9MYCO|nr:TetR/AcrR family transcriptional regulator [Mycolicibacterium insubricum]MCB9441662.1 TetR/AcrR family transcriptional regulator [Mycolicibacterium sp.]MCV7080338.1 TetR/AcrR family transcriptional regulator [Mycolicibacterium insubricum]ORA66108.1 TetR family transcriptional regulator [Mycolicibacterium insubricum]